MLCKLVLSTLFYCVLSAFPYPNIFEIHSCTILVNGRNVTFENSFVHTIYNEDVIYFSACRELSQVGCDENALACVRIKDRFINFVNVVNETVDYFTLGSDYNYRQYEFEVHLSHKTKYKVTKQNDYKYLLEIDLDYNEYCTKMINKRKLFFNKLSKDIVIENENEMLFLNLCGAPKECNNSNIAVCARNKTTSSITAMGEINTLNIHDGRGEIVFYYKTTPRKTERIVSIVLKCNWTTLFRHHLFRRISFKKVEVVIETYLACTKSKPHCIFQDSENYLYNLTGLSRFNGWNLNLNNIRNTVVKLNICGTLKTEKLCSDQQSQICSADGQNYGSITTPMVVENDLIKFTIKDGSQCTKMTDRNLMTSFELQCSFKEEEPQLVNETDCNLEIRWKTPFACPVLSNKVNYNIAKESSEKVNCMVEDGDLKYDLIQLSKNTKNYVVNNDNLEFLLNVCKPVVSGDDTFCQRSMGMCLKNNSEPNVKRKFIGIGSAQTPTVENGQLVLKFVRGFLCKKHMKDFSAIIYFNCSDEEVITFVQENQCVYEFIWKTKQACPNRNECVFRDDLDNIIDLTNVKLTNFQFENNDTKYNINICKNQVVETNSEYNRNIEVVRNVYNNKNNTFIEYKIDKSCNAMRDFNTIRIYLDCDPLLNNEHYDFINISQCTVYLKLRRNNFCKTDLAVNVEASPKNYYNLYTINEEIKNCIIQYKDQEIHLNSFEPIKVMSKGKQYTIGINKTSCCCHQFICNEDKPLATLNKCPKTRLQDEELKLTFNGTSELSYISEVTFYCKMKEALPEVAFESNSLISFRYPLDSLCNQSSTSGSVIAGIVSCVFIILLGILGYCNKGFIIRNCRKRSKSETYIYCKNSED